MTTADLLADSKFIYICCLLIVNNAPAQVVRCRPYFRPGRCSSIHFYNYPVQIYVYGDNCPKLWNGLQMAKYECNCPCYKIIQYNGCIQKLDKSTLLQICPIKRGGNPAIYFTLCKSAEGPRVGDGGAGRGGGVQNYKF